MGTFRFIKSAVVYFNVESESLEAAEMIADSVAEEIFSEDKQAFANGGFVSLDEGPADFYGDEELPLVLPNDGDQIPFYCQDCNYHGPQEDFWPSNGNAAPVVCPECGRTNCFSVDK